MNEDRAQEMQGLQGAVDLGRMVNEKNIVMGVRPEMKFAVVEGEDGDGNKVKGQVPLLELSFLMGNGEERKGVCIQPGMVMLLVNVLSTFGVQVGGGTQQQAGPDGGLSSGGI